MLMDWPFVLALSQLYSSTPTSTISASSSRREIQFRLALPRGRLLPAPPGPGPPVLLAGRLGGPPCGLLRAFFAGNSAITRVNGDGDSSDAARSDDRESIFARASLSGGERTRSRCACARDAELARRTTGNPS